MQRSFSFSRESPLSPNPKSRLPPSVAKTTTTLPKYCPPSCVTRATTLHRHKHRPHLPENWLESLGCEDTDGKFSKEEVKRQEVRTYMYLYVHSYIVHFIYMYFLCVCVCVCTCLKECVQMYMYMYIYYTCTYSNARVLDPQFIVLATLTIPHSH